MLLSSYARKNRYLRTLVLNQKRHGYIVLVPELGEDLPDNNPLIRKDGLPEFNDITIEKCVAAIGKQAIEVEKNVQIIESADKTIDVFADILHPLEEIDNQLETTWGLAKTLYLANSSLMPTKSYLFIHERARRARTTKFNSPFISKTLSDFKSQQKTILSEPQERLINKFLLESKLNGVELNEKNKYVLLETMVKLRQEKTKFREKVELSVSKFAYTINDFDVVKDFPIYTLQCMAADSKNPSKGPWKVSLQPNIYHSFLENCENRDLRWNIWQAFNLKASGYADKLLSNSVHIEEIRYLRRLQAKLLGYNNFVDISMKTKMAGSEANVQNMIFNFMTYARPAQKSEIQMLQKYANENGFKGNLELYDVPFWKNKHLKNVYHYDNSLIREYFPLPNVLSGLFELSEQLFQIKIVERPGISTWHEDVKFFDIFDVSSNKTEPIAGFYLDLFSRENNKNRMNGKSGEMIGIRNRCSVLNSCPLSALIFNLEPPIYGKPSLLSFKDVKSLFNKFGYSFQHLLTEANYSELAGLSNIEWDAVEVCGSVMIHLLYHQDTIKSISSHYSTKEPLPDHLIKAIQHERKHTSGNSLCHELYIASLDLALHSKKDFWTDIMKKLWPEYNIFPLDKKDAHPCSLNSIFSGDWDAAYFSHIWSQLIAADVYSAFHEAQNNPQDMQLVGKRFRDTYLALGGSCHPSEVFRRFRGRDPSPKALLKTLGLDKTNINQQNIK